MRRCPFCTNEFDTDEHYLSHVQRKHPGKNPEAKPTVIVPATVLAREDKKYRK